MFELILNILLMVFLGFTYFTHVIEAAIPMNVQKNPYALSPAVWPSAIIILLEICLLINVIMVIKKNKGKEDFNIGAFLKSIPAFLKSRLFIGIIILAVASFILEPLGFIVTSILLLIAYGALLGEKKYGRLVLCAVVITMVLYICFSGLLSVNLPRGTVPFLRNFALSLEGIMSKIKGIF